METVEICSNCGAPDDGNECYCSHCGGTFEDSKDVGFDPIAQEDLLKYERLYEFVE